MSTQTLRPYLANPDLWLSVWDLSVHFFRTRNCTSDMYDQFNNETHAWTVATRLRTPHEVAHGL